MMKDDNNTKEYNNNYNNKQQTKNIENIRNETYLHLEKLKAEKAAANLYRAELEKNKEIKNE